MTPQITVGLFYANVSNEVLNPAKVWESTEILKTASAAVMSEISDITATISNYLLIFLRKMHRDCRTELFRETVKFIDVV